jgi:hypothetical protein
MPPDLQRAAHRLPRARDRRRGRRRRGRARGRRRRRALGARDLHRRQRRPDCGACGTACAERAGVLRGAADLLRRGLTDCSGVCRDLQTDHRNCGACGTAAPAGQVCSAGLHGELRRRALTNCAASAATCRPTRQLRRVRPRLPLGAGLLRAACARSCGAGTTNCAGVCRDLQTDRNNCGACGTPAPRAGVHQRHVPGVAAAAGTTNCSGVCRDLQTDSPTAAPAAPCARGAGVLRRRLPVSCGAGTTNCSGVCRDLQTDNANCGACGRAARGPGVLAGACARCRAVGHHQLLGRLPRPADRQQPLRRLRPRVPAGQVCSRGMCQVSCGAGTHQLRGVCRDLQTDNANCGACGNACAAGQVCSAACARCRARGLDQLLGRLPRPRHRQQQLRRLRQRLPVGQVCSAGVHGVVRRRAHQLLGRLPRPADRRNHCGACGRACAAGQVCSAGAARCPAAAGTTNCSGVCRDLSTDRQRQLRRVRHGLRRGQVCTARALRVSCAAGRPTARAPAATCRPTNNCGACGRACAVGQVCSAGVQVSCLAGHTNCSGVCRDLRPTTPTAAPAAARARRAGVLAGYVRVSCVRGHDQLLGRVPRPQHRQQPTAAPAAAAARRGRCAPGGTCNRCRARRAPPTARACAATSDRQRQLRRLRTSPRGSPSPPTGRACSTCAPRAR